jgi:hypothetical protein
MNPLPRWADVLPATVDDGTGTIICVSRNMRLACGPGGSGDDLIRHLVWRSPREPPASA